MYEWDFSGKTKRLYTKICRLEGKQIDEFERLQESLESIRKGENAFAENSKISLRMTAQY